MVHHAFDRGRLTADGDLLPALRSAVCRLSSAFKMKSSLIMATPFYERLARALLNLEWVWLAAILPLILFLPEQTFGLLLLTPLFWLLRRYLDGRFLPNTPLNLSLAVMAAMAAVGVSLTPDMSLTLPKAAGLAYGGALFSVVAAQAGRSQRHLTVALCLFLAAGLIVASFGLLGIRWSSIKFPILLEFLPRLTPSVAVRLPGASEGVSPNQLAGSLLWLLPVFFSLAAASVIKIAPMIRRLRWSGWLLSLLLIWPGFLFFTTVFLLTQSRSAFLGFAVGVVVIILLTFWPYRYYLLAAAPVVLLLLYLLAQQPQVAQRLAAFDIEPDRLLNPDRDLGEAFVGRQAIWAASLDTFLDAPWTGVGLGAGRVVVPARYGHYFRRPMTDIAHAHNHLLQAGLDLGLPGLVAYLALWLGAAVMIGRTLRATGDPWLNALAVGFAGALIAYFVYGISDAVALGGRPGFIFWYLLGLITAVHALGTRSN
jgi:putative inorganic carbon (HCO3(-)) transporter